MRRPAPGSRAGFPGARSPAIANLADGTTEALRERRFAAIAIDDVGANQWPMVFCAGLLGPDGQPGTADDPHVRLDRALLTDPSAQRPLVGYRVDSPYAIVPRR